MSLYKISAINDCLTLKDGSIAILQEDTRVLTILESRVILIRDSRVYHHDIMLIMIMKVSDELLDLLQREPVRIQSENLVIISFRIALVGC